MNKAVSVIVCLPLLFFSIIPIAATTVRVQDLNSPQPLPLPDKSLQENDIDLAYRNAPDDDRETQLKKERIRSALIEIKYKQTRVNQGQDGVLTLLECQQRLVTALLDFHKEPKTIISLLEKNVEAAKGIETDRKLRFDNGVGRPDDLAQATYVRADIELQLLRAKKKYNVGDGLSRPEQRPGDLPHDVLGRVDRLVREFEEELRGSGKFYPPESNELRSDNKQQARPDNLIDEWKIGKFSPEPYKINLGDDEETRLKKQRINVALMEISHFQILMDAGTESPVLLFETQKKLLEAQLDLHSEPKKIVSALQKAFESAKQTETIVQVQFDAGAEVNIQQVGQAAYNRLDCEIKLLRAKNKYQFIDGDGTVD